MLKFAIIGVGGLGKTHYRNVKEVTKKAGNVKLVALCDVEDSAFSTQTATNLGDAEADLDFSAYHLYKDVETLLEKETLDFVITALPTDIHEEVAVKVMNKGIHVFSEKPMAINLTQAENMLKVAKENNVKLMIGQCLRYSGPYLMLKDIIESEKYGKVISADFFRISPTPSWSWKSWMLDEAKSGGAILDLHVHDVDFINWVFGMPKAVTSFATNYKTKHDSVNTVYHYDDKHVTATGDWGMPECFQFQSGFTVRFEAATIVRNSEGMYLYPENGEAIELHPTMDKMHAEEVVDFINCIREDKESVVNPATDSCNSLKIALAEKVSADTGKTVML